MNCQSPGGVQDAWMATDVSIMRQRGRIRCVWRNQQDLISTFPSKASSILTPSFHGKLWGILSTCSPQHTQLPADPSPLLWNASYSMMFIRMAASFLFSLSPLLYDLHKNSPYLPPGNFTALLPVWKTCEVYGWITPVAFAWLFIFVWVIICSTFSPRAIFGTRQKGNT